MQNYTKIYEIAFPVKDDDSRLVNSPGFQVKLLMMKGIPASGLASMNRHITMENIRYMFFTISCLYGRSISISVFVLLSTIKIGFIRE